MSLAAGRSILHYRLESPIGQGGMGVVWRGHDTSLGRDVALKFLPELLAGDPERMARLEREARLLAQLNHPRIAAIHGFHHADGARFLVMELVEGEDLAQRLAHGPIPVAEALPLALQIAEALEHAHEKGVIHRDLKPANIKLDAAGGAKVLDFGLAKAIEGDPVTSRSGAGLSHSPTITGGMTAAHVLLGTAAYMSPEQARGQVADRRADIWAFGVVLMEMLTGRRLFEGETVSDTLAAVLRSDPDFTTLPAGTPPRVRTLLRRCLDRDPKRRLRDIGEARIALDETLRGVPDEGVSAAAAPAPIHRLPWLPGLAGLALGALATFGLLRATAPPRPEPALRKFMVEPDTSSGTPVSPVISPDGRFVASILGGRVAIRDLTRFDARSFPLEANAQALFWSPDARDLGYFAGTRILRLSVADGRSQVLSDTRAEFTGGTGGFWTPRGSILFSRGDSLGVMEISERGGDPRVIMPADTKVEGDVHEPHELPGGRGIVFASHTHRAGISQLCLWAGGKRKVLLDLKDQTISWPRYSPSGHLVFHRAPNTPGVWAVPFSLAKLEVTGEPFLVEADAVSPSVSLDGTLCYRPGRGAVATQMVLLDRQAGGITPIGEPTARASYAIGADPTGPRVARAEAEASGSDIWVHDHVRGTRTRLTFDPGEEDQPDWSPDGRALAYGARALNCAAAECWVIMVAPSDGGGRAETLATAAALPAFTPDGRDVLYTGFRGGGTHWDVMRVPRDRSSAPVMLVPGNPRAIEGRLSPDGTLLAYMSSESGRFEVYLTRYPSLEGRWQASNAGGQWPRWSARGDRLYFSRGDEILEVEVVAGASPTLGNPRSFATRPHAGPFPFGFDMGFAVSADGRRLYTARTPELGRRAPRLAIVQNWAAEFRDRK
jgi:hypothetical protein